MKNKFLCFIILCLASVISFAQLSDLARIEYLGLPGSSDGGASLNRYRALANYPVQLKKEGSFLLIGIDYR